MRRLLGVGLLAGVLLASAAPGVGAQEGPVAGGPDRCELVDSRAVRSIAAGGGSRITYVGLPRIRCRDGTRLEADSAVVFEATRLTQLIGNVFFDDAESRLTAERANYFEEQRRLRAWGEPVLIDKVNRSVIRGDSLLLLRPGPARQTGELTVTGERPRATLHPERSDDLLEEDTLAEDTVIVVDEAADDPPDDPSDVPADAPGAEPYEVEADRLHFRGQEYMLATGDVVVERGDSLDASADTLEYLRDRSRMELRRDARVVRVDLSLEGRTIVLLLPDDEIREVTAREEAVLVGEDLRLDAGTIRLFFEAQELERLVAVGDSGASPPAGRALAVTEEYVLDADSIDVRSPGGELRSLTAVGGARAEGTGREVLDVPEAPEILRTDWIEGDTVVALFEPVTPDAEREPDAAPPPDAAPGTEAADEERRYRLDELLATGNARSLYRIEPSDADFEPGRDLPSASYVVGRSIRIVLEGEEIARLEVEDLDRGIHLEARARRDAPPPAGEEDGEEGGETDVGEDSGEAP